MNNKPSLSFGLITIILCVDVMVEGYSFWDMYKAFEVERLNRMFHHLLLKVYRNSDKQYYDCLRFKELPRALQTIIKEHHFHPGFHVLPREDFPENMRRVVDSYYPYTKELCIEGIHEIFFCNFPNHEAEEA